MARGQAAPEVQEHGVLPTRAIDDLSLDKLELADEPARLVGFADCEERIRPESLALGSRLSLEREHVGRRRAIVGKCVDASEPTPKQLAHVIHVVRRTHATTVFFETLVSPRLADTVAREVGARTAVLDPIEGVTLAEQKRGDNYLTLMRRNLAALRKALACR